MGTDNRFHRRKAKMARDLTRHKAKREPYAKVLIVCEGEKTEPHYFNGLKDHYGLNGANVEVCGNCGSDPLSIYRYARQRYREEKNAGDAFDKVFCVFDKDTHANYGPSLDAIRDAAPNGVYVHITSVPCFEYWLLLHFNFTTRAYVRLAGNSACNQVVTELRTQREMKNYAKGDKNIFLTLFSRLDSAKSNAEKSLKAAANSDTDNPTTHVHKLVEFLQGIKAPE